MTLSSENVFGYIWTNAYLMKFLIPAGLLLPVLLLSPAHAQLTTAGLDVCKRPVTQLEKAEQEGWTEDIKAREIYSSTYEASDGKKIVYQSKQPVNYTNNKGELTPIDIRFTANGSGWSSVQRPDAVEISKKGHASLAHLQGFSFDFSITQSINGSTVFDYGHTSFTQASTVRFENILPGIDKLYNSRYNGVKYSYEIKTPQSTIGSHFIIREKFQLPKDFVLKESAEEGEKTADGWKGNLLVSHIKNKKEYGKIYSLLCYDANNAAIQGSYRITSAGKNDYILEMLVPNTWLNDPGRKYPVMIDPLVTGATASYGFIYMASCFFPSYNVDSINVTVPAGITVTALNVTASFYADPFTTTVMADGRMFFTTSCPNPTTIFQVAPPAGSSPGTAYLDNFDLRSPIMCCYPQSCTSYNFWLKFHLSRTTNGTACNTTYLYYDPFGTLWPFSAYIEGYTSEAYASEMSFTPGVLCANTCTLQARIYARYGVPPYTFTHPWSADTIVGGSAVGCGTGAVFKVLDLTVPSCPNYCDTATSLDIPSPTVIDACGMVVSNYDPTYDLPLKPVPIVQFGTDHIELCSGDDIAVTITSCLPGSDITWNGNGNSGTSLVLDTLYNAGTGVQSVSYAAYVSRNGCTGIGDTLVVDIYPPPTADFSVQEGTMVPNNPINFINETALNGNTLAGWLWHFGDGDSSVVQNAMHTYADTGLYKVCLSVYTLLGCNDSVCQVIHVIDDELELPNVVTPNGDGINDVLYIKSLEYYPKNKLMVFNRWGTLVFEKENYANDWKPSNLSEGAYYYILETPNKDAKTSVLQVIKK